MESILENKGKIFLATVAFLFLAWWYSATLTVGGPVDDIKSQEVPPVGFVLDEPESNPGNVRARMELLTAGGYYKDREIYVIYTKETHPDNLAVLDEFNVVSKKMKEGKIKNEMKDEMAVDLPSEEKIIIESK